MHEEDQCLRIVQSILTESPDEEELFFSKSSKEKNEHGGGAEAGIGLGALEAGVGGGVIADDAFQGGAFTKWIHVSPSFGDSLFSNVSSTDMSLTADHFQYSFLPPFAPPPPVDENCLYDECLQQQPSAHPLASTTTTDLSSNPLNTLTTNDAYLSANPLNTLNAAPTFMDQGMVGGMNQYAQRCSHQQLNELDLNHPYMSMGMSYHVSPYLQHPDYYHVSPTMPWVGGECYDGVVHPCYVWESPCVPACVSPPGPDLGAVASASACVLNDETDMFLGAGGMEDSVWMGDGSDHERAGEVSAGLAIFRQLRNAVSNNEEDEEEKEVTYNSQEQENMGQALFPGDQENVFLDHFHPNAQKIGTEWVYDGYTTGDQSTPQLSLSLEQFNRTKLSDKDVLCELRKRGEKTWISQWKNEIQPPSDRTLTALLF